MDARAFEYKSVPKAANIGVYFQRVAVGNWSIFDFWSDSYIMYR